MRAFLKQFGLFLAIQLVIGVAVFWSYRRQYPASHNYLAASIDKQSLLRTQAPPRLVFIGGSSMAFGVDSARIAAACGRRPVNMGLHAALGLKWMLNETAPGLQQGDWIILAPEYQQFTRLSGTSEMLVNMVEIDPANARVLDRHQWAEALDLGFIQRAGKIARAVLGRPGRFFRSNSLAKSTRTYYRRVGFNANGDIVAHLTAPKPKMTEREFRFRYREDLARESFDLINHFVQRAEARGAKVFFSHPPLPKEVFEPHRAEFEKLDSALRANLRIPMLESVEEMTFPVGDFFDTWYHLAATGVEKRTALLGERISRQAGSTAPAAP